MPAGMVLCHLAKLTELTESTRVIPNSPDIFDPVQMEGKSGALRLKFCTYKWKVEFMKCLNVTKTLFMTQKR